MAAEAPVRQVWLRPVLWTLLYGAAIAYGAYALWRIPVEVLPRFDFPEIRVVTQMPGFTSTELEALIVRPLEGEILALPNLASVRSVMGNGTAETDIRFGEDTRAQQDLQAVNSAIDRARRELPAAAQPLAEIMGNAINEVADYALWIPADISSAAAQRAVEANVVPQLRALPGVQRVEVFGTGEEALWVQPNLTAMHRFGVSAAALTQAIQGQVLLGPSGYIAQGHQDVLVEARNLPTRISQLEEIPVAAPAGPIPLGDLSRVVRSAVPTRNAVELDGRPSIALVVLKQPEASTVPVARAVQAALAQTRNQLPAGVHWVGIYDQGHIVHLIGSDLGRNLLIGALLAAGVLLWVLGAGRGIWVLAASIPLALLLGIAGLYALGQSLNLLTLGALTVALGLLADDAIIVLESIYFCWERGDGHWEGIWRGLRSIALPDLTGTLTNVAIYLPLLFVGGLAGLFFLPFALAMTLVLVASLAISLSLIPLGLGFIGAGPRAAPTAGARMTERLRQWNERLFEIVVRYPRSSLAATFAVLVASLLALALVPIDFLPLPNEGVLLESFTLPPGSSLIDTEVAVEAMTRRLSADPAVAHVFARIGSASSTEYTEPPYAGEIQVVMKPGIGVNSLDRIGRRVARESKLAGVQTSVDTPTVERLGESLSGLPQPFVIQLFGNDLTRLRALSNQIVARLKPIPALSELFDNDGYPITQLELRPRIEALSAHHLTPAQWYAQIDPLLRGEVIAQVPDGNVPLALYIRLADATAMPPEALAQLPIRTQGWTPLGELADIDLATTPNQIRHVAGARVLEISATPAGPLGSTIAAARRALANLRLPGGYRIAFGGLDAELERALFALGVATVAALLLMLAILVLQFEGLLVPGLLMLEIPLALMGGAVALLVSGVGLNGIALVGFLTLIGIGLRHGIVLLDRARRNEASGMSLADAVHEAIEARFRPIVLTAIVGALAMLPTALGLGKGAAPEQGLAIVILGGLLWSAVRSTNLIPALYLHWRRRQLAPRASPPPSVG